MNNGPELGKIIEDGTEARRDAIHIAVAPCIASRTLYPGDRIVLLDNGEADWPGDQMAPNTIGIVDPFLSGPVMDGERFWLFLYPGTITGLRHVWTHPAFITKIPGKE